MGDGPPADACERDILGRTNREAALQTQERAPGPTFDDEGKPVAFAPPDAAVSPSAPAVRDRLTALVRALAARPGLAGFVWEDAVADDALGYTPDMRLAFLRAAHADPLDLTPDNYASYDVSLPLWDDAAEGALSGRWSEARKAANTALLLQMRQAVGEAGRSLPILMAQSAGRTDWLASWDDASQAPPPLRDILPDDSYPERAQILPVARKQGRAVLLRETVKDAGDADALARSLASDLKDAPWDGFVLGLPPEATRGSAPLAVLVGAVGKH